MYSKLQAIETPSGIHVSSCGQVDYKWVPKDVITAAGQYEIEEPDWGSLPQMSYMRFYKVCCLLLVHEARLVPRAGLVRWQYRDVFSCPFIAAARLQIPC